MPSSQQLTTTEIKSLLSTFDGCLIDFKYNDKNIFDDEQLIVFAKEDAMYIESVDTDTKKTNSTRIVVLYHNIRSLELSHQTVIIITLNNSTFELTLKKTA